MNTEFHTWTPAQKMGWKEMSLCQWAPYHGRDGLRDEWQMASVISPGPSLLGTFAFCVSFCFGGVCLLVLCFKVLRSFANYSNRTGD